MGSSLKLGKWIGIGFVIMAVIFIGMAVMRGFDSFIAEDGDKLELVNNHELNNGLSPYKGAIKGTRVRQLFNYLAKNAKDIAAGAVFVMSIFSVVIGILIFLPKILEMLGVR